ncbi:choice-of-anchor B family protein [Wenzhouxiangella sp. XN24]|uniref:choice-of-anchor B family protein n=1 Tax=Wenzhouxiangella sp. XN24 TaxID=2713569 RepID=UPI0013ED0CA3|nr:choice-of-anchor B family protein [Wenzhouxiangella sp. XN24]NGX15574.1 choice-of-anchor B family protein [Wenzhouxiangella sp. XN24]
MKTSTLACLCLAMLAGCGGGGGGDGHHDGGHTPPPGGSLPDWSTGPADCLDGMAGEFPCSAVDLLGRVPLDTMGGNAGNDLWAWTDAVTGREYALMGMDNGTAFVDVTEPLAPVFLGRLPTRTVASTWRDIKVYQDHAYIVADGAGAHGMQIFDLTRLRGVTAPEIFNADGVYLQFSNAHNLAINEDTGFAYAVGSNSCGGGLHIIDIRTPNNPMFAGCHGPRYTHDTQCVTYQGPDAQFTGREICVSADENRFAINDVTLKSSPVTLASITYPGMVYAHQGWLSEDHRYFFLGDELDELNLGVPTRTHVFDLAELTAPQHLYAHEADTPATDHNLYVLGDRLFQANYSVGLRVLEFGDLAAGDIDEIAFFDTHPPNDARGFNGAWSVYPYLDSGTLLVSDTRGGLFILALR